MNAIDQQPESARATTWTVPREWAGETAFLIGGGPSLRGFPVDRLRGRGRVIVINRMVLPSEEWPGVPWADVLYFCDCGFWSTFRHEVRAIWQGGRKVTLCNGWVSADGKAVPAAGGGDEDLFRLVRAIRYGLSHDPQKLCHGSSSGYQAINLAYLFGADRIVLLGYDLQPDAAGRSHAHEGYGQSASLVSHQLGVHAGAFPYLVEPLRAAGVEVLNASPSSVLNCWPKIRLETALTL